MCVVLQQVDLHEYLDTQSLVALSRASASCLSIVRDHIEKCCTFIFSPSMQDDMKPVAMVMYSKAQVFSMENYHPRYVPTSITFLKKAPYITPLPSSLTHITFDNYFNGTLEHLPPSITFIKAGDSFDSDICYLPKLKYLIFGKFFDKPVSNLPPTLVHLTINSIAFDQSVSRLPSSLTHLSIASAAFNNRVSRLPGTLTHLFIACGVFRRPVNNLPPSLTHLSIRSRLFNHPVNNLPSTLLYFSIRGDGFCQSLSYHTHSHTLAQDWLLNTLSY
jgi:hypothetical protein